MATTVPTTVSDPTASGRHTAAPSAAPAIARGLACLTRLARLAAALACGLALQGAWGDPLRVGQTLRNYTASVPDAARGVPLVLVLHGHSQRGRDLTMRSSWPEVAARERFAVVFPDGINRAWADLRAPSERLGAPPPPGTDDVAFLLALVDDFVASGVADPRRIYVSGVSNGGAMAMTLACLRADRVAAIATVVMNLTPSLAAACTPTAQVPVLLMNGTADPLVPFAGGTGRGRRGSAGGYLSTAETLSFWRRADGCAAEDGSVEPLPDADPADHSTVTRIGSRCPAGTDVVLYRIDGGGHRMPGRGSDARYPALVDPVLGFQNHDIDAPEEIWRFLRRFRRP